MAGTVSPARLAPARLAYFASAHFAVPILRALDAENARYRLEFVVTRPPRPAGRGQRRRPNPIDAEARALGHCVLYTPSLDQLRALDVAVVLAYGRKITPSELVAPRCGFVNLHPSLLPRWRGAAPIERALMAGDRQTGIAVMTMNDTLDGGGVYQTFSEPIEDEDRIETLSSRLGVLAARALLETLPQILSGSLIARPQDEARACYAEKITAADRTVDWLASARLVCRRINALSARGGVEFDLSSALENAFGEDALGKNALGKNATRARLSPVLLRRACLADARLVDLPGGEFAAGEATTHKARSAIHKPGELMSLDPLVIACGQGAVVVTRLQRPGGCELDAADFLRGAGVPRVAKPRVAEPRTAKRLASKPRSSKKPRAAKEPSSEISNPIF